MSFPKAPLKRFNEHVGCAPAPGSYDVKLSDSLKGPVSFEKSQRFRAKKDLAGESQSSDRDEEPTSPARLKKHSSLGSTPNLRQKPERDVEFVRDMKKQKALEKEIRSLLKERADQGKKLQLLEEEFKKTEQKLVTAVREKTSLTASIASLERQMADLNKANELLKTKFSDDSSKRKINSLYAELMEAKNKMDAKDKDISLKHLSLKAAFLVAITSARRLGEIQALSCRDPYLTIFPDRIVLRLDPGFLPKVVLDFHRDQEIILPSFPKDCPSQDRFQLLDVRDTIIHYLDSTKEFRKDDYLFVQYAGPNKGGEKASKATIGRWIRSTIICWV